MKTRYYITETYCCGNLGTGYAVKTKAEALAILEQVKTYNEPNAYIKIEEQEIKWFERYWRYVDTVAEWWN